MSISIPPDRTAGASSSDAPTLASASAFGSALASSQTAPAFGSVSLRTSGNSIDTGRYLISASRDYTAPGGASQSDGMLRIYDKTNGSYAEVFGDPHLYTSAGEAGEFKQEGLALQLADGTQVQIKPTAVVDGVAHIDSVAITKNGQTVLQSGFFAADGGGGIQTGAVQNGGPSAADGFNDLGDTVLHVDGSGDLGLLATASGSRLDSTSLYTSLDGLGGGSAFLADSLTSGLDAYTSAINDQTSKGGDGPNAASQSQPAAGTGSIIPEAGIGTDDPSGVNPEPSPQALTTSSPSTTPAVTTTAAGTLHSQPTAVPQPAGDTSSIAALPVSPQTPASSAGPTTVNLHQLQGDAPSAGISMSTIEAMLAEANGTGPRVII